MIKKKKNYNYYKLDVGFFPDVVKLCFDDKVFQQILKDHEITLKASALDHGIAETHVIGDGKDAIIILVFNVALFNDDLSELVDTIAHEVSHAVDNLAEHIGEDDNFVHETRAYLTGHLAGQVFKICMHEKEKYARKANRKILSKKGQGVGRPVVQVDLNSNGGSGSFSVPSGTGMVGGIEDHLRDYLSSPDLSIWWTRRAGFSCLYFAYVRRHRGIYWWGDQESITTKSGM